MSPEPVNYEAVLADLLAKREALDRAIAGIQQILGQTPSLEPPDNGTAISSLPGRTEVQRIAGDTFFGMNVANAAKKFLRIQKRPQSTKAIAEALQLGGLQTLSQNFYATVYTALQREEGSADGFVRVKKDWGLAEWYPGAAKGKRMATESEG